jgi:RNA polymerase sigma-70 factor, ECF subfamily
MPTEREKELELIERVRAAVDGRGPAAPGLADEIDALFAAHQARVYGVCRHMVRDPEQAQELAQEVLLTAWRRLPEFRGEAAFSTWLYSIARHTCFNAIRKRQELLSDDGVLESTDPAAGVMSSLHRHQRQELLRLAAEAVLDPLEQEAVHLRYVEQLPQETITDLLDISDASGARGVLQRCRRKLGRELRGRLATLGHGSTFMRGSLV